MVNSKYELVTFVLGMHRSGTSALARVLMLLGGAAPANLLQPSETNERGFWESPKIVALNNDLLKQFDSDWHSVSPLVGKGGGNSAETREAIISVVADQFSQASQPVIKDPRICRLVEPWIDAMDQRADRMVFPFIVRNPSEVAASLTSRNGFSMVLGMLLWARYYLDAEHATRGWPRAVVAYDDLLADWRGVAGNLSRQLGVDFTLCPAVAEEIDGFLSTDLHRQRVDEDQLRQDLVAYPIVEELYDVLSGWVRIGTLSDAEMARLDGLRSDVDRIGQLVGRVLEENRLIEKRRLEEKKAPNVETQSRSTDELQQLHLTQQARLDVLDKRLKHLLQQTTSAEVYSQRLEAAERGAARERAALREQYAQQVSVFASSTETARYREEQLLETLARQQSEHRNAAAAASREAEDLRNRICRLRNERDEAHQSAQIATYKVEDVARQLAVAEQQVAMLREQAAAGEALAEGYALEIASLADERDAFKLQASALVDEVEAQRRDEDKRARDREAEAWQRDLQETLRKEAEARAWEEVLVRQRGVSDHLKEVTRKYRSTQATLARTKIALDQSRARTSALEDELNAANAEVRRLKHKLIMRIAQAMTKPLRTSSSLRGFFANPRRSTRSQAAMISECGLFDPKWYLARYPDVNSEWADPMQHYLLHGWKESRDPGPNFSVSRYLRDNPDVARAGVNPLLHFIEYGQAEGRVMRQSKLAVAPASSLPAFAAAAPIHRAAVAEPIPTAFADTNAPDNFETLCQRCAEWPSTDLALRRFCQLTGLAGAPFDDAAWQSVEDDGRDGPLDGWFVDDLMLRLRWPSPSYSNLVFAQLDPVDGCVAILTKASCATDLDFVDIPLRSALYPVIVGSFAKDGQRARAWTIAFPSLLRGGVHHCEFQSEIARPDGRDKLTPVEYSAVLAGRWAKLRKATAVPAIAAILADVKDAKGTGHLMDPAFRRWLHDVFAIPIALWEEPECAGEQYIGTSVALAGTPRGPGASLVIHADSIPSLSILCAAWEDEGRDMADYAIGCPHSSYGDDVSRPGHTIVMPPVKMAEPHAARLAHFTRQPRMNGGRLPTKPLPTAALATEPSIPLHDAELLFPVSAAEPLTDHRPAALCLILESNRDNKSLSATLEALTMQDCAHAVSIALIGQSDVAAIEHAKNLFPGRVSLHLDWQSAANAVKEGLCGSITPGVVLHDLRTLSVLADFVASGAASASCPLVISERRGKGWSTRVVNNGLVPEMLSDLHWSTEIASSSVLWRGTYPVRLPVPGLWLALAEKVTNWTRNDIHRLDRSDGLHWCTAVTSASVLSSSLTEPVFVPPIADPACFTSIRVIMG